VYGGVLQKNQLLSGLILGAALVSSVVGCNRAETGADALAKVNGEKITREEVDKYFKNQTSGSPQQPTGDQAASLRLSILKQLIDDEMMMQRARKLNLLATDEEVEAKFTEFKAPYTPEEFEKRLKDSNMSLEDLKRNLRKSLTLEKVINKEITSKINITDGDITKYYNDHKTEFNLIEPQYHLAQIVVKTLPNPQVSNLKNDKAQNEGDAKKKVQMIMNRLDSGEDFATVAMNYSEQPATSANGGDMGFIPESSLKQEPQMMELIGRLKSGQSTPPLPIVDPGSRRLVGFRIIKLIAREPAGQRELSDPRVQAAVRQQLRERREQLLKAAYYETVRNESDVVNYLAQDLVKNTGTTKN
jgi:peptidyl-prolyl cis-trans isomerase SurA